MHPAHTIFLSLLQAMREPTLRDGIGVRAFFVALPQAQTIAADAEKLEESSRGKKVAHDTAKCSKGC